MSLISTIIISYILIILLFVIALSYKKQSLEDAFFIKMYPKTYADVVQRLIALEKIRPGRINVYKAQLDRYLKKFPGISINISNRLEYYFQAAYFNNFKDKFIAFKSAGLHIRIFVLFVLFVNNAGIAILGYFLLEFYKDYSFLAYYFYFSIVLTPVVLTVAMIQFMVIGLILSLASLFDKSGKIRRVAVHLDEMVRSIKPGGRKAIVWQPNMDNLFH